MGATAKAVADSIDSLADVWPEAGKDELEVTEMKGVAKVLRNTYRSGFNNLSYLARNYRDIRKY